MWKWFKHLFVHEWYIECEYVAARRYGNSMWSTYNKVMVCKTCGKLKHYHIKLRDISGLPKSVAVRHLLEDVELLKRQGMLTKYFSASPETK